MITWNLTYLGTANNNKNATPPLEKTVAYGPSKSLNLTLDSLLDSVLCINVILFFRHPFTFSLTDRSSLLITETEISWFCFLLRKIGNQKYF